MRRLVLVCAIATALGWFLTLPSSAGAESTQAPASVIRLGGEDRYATSLLVAEAVADELGGQLDTVIMASGRHWPEAVVAASIAGHTDAPVLLTPPTELRADALEFLVRTRVSRAVLISTGATVEERTISPVVASMLESAGIAVEWIGGSDHYETGVAAARRIRTVGTLGPFGVAALVASGEVFADALVAGPLAAHGRHPVLLTPRSHLDEGVEDYLAESSIRHVVMLGGTAALSAAVEDSIRDLGLSISRLDGATRFETATLMVSLMFEHSGGTCFSGAEVGLARAHVPFDSLSAAPLLALRCAPLLLSNVTTLPHETAAFLDEIRERAGDTQMRLTIFGGEKAVAGSAVEAYAATSKSASDEAIEPKVLPAGSCGGSATDPPVRIGSPSGWVHDPTWSPDCRHIAYVQDGALWRADTDGSTRIALFEVPYFGSSFRDSFRPHHATWSPDGDHIAFVVVDETVKPRVTHLHVIGADGTGLRQLSHGDLNDHSPTWSPDSRSIAVVRETGASVYESGRHRWGVFALVVIDVETGAAETRVPAGEFRNTHIRWSPDGTQFAFRRGTDLWIMDADGSNAEHLFDPSPEGGVSAAHAMSWSPDGRQIAFVGGPDLTKENIHIVNVDGSGHRALEGPSGILFDPAWSPDGTRIAYVDSKFRDLDDRYVAIWDLQLWIIGVDATG